MKQEKGNGHIRPCAPLGGGTFHDVVADGNDQVGPVEQLVHIVFLGDADGPQAVFVVHGDDALGHHGVHNRNVQPVCQLGDIGGGISAAEALLPAIQAELDWLFERCTVMPAVKPELVRCRYGNDANLIGALKLFFEQNPA